jgi:hypothetical protein
MRERDLIQDLLVLSYMGWVSVLTWWSMAQGWT